MYGYNKSILEMLELPSITFEGKTVEQFDLFNKAVTINTMMKGGERGRLSRRSIATVSMLLRGFVKVTEDLTKEILTIVPNSGLPVEGVEKLAKLSSLLNIPHKGVTGELSGDIEKWNECLDPDSMRLVLSQYLLIAGLTPEEIE